jgi:hypothetical protein
VAVYAITQLRLIDRTTYDRCRARFMKVFCHRRGPLFAKGLA